MKSLKVDLKKLSPEAIDRIIEAVRNEPGGNVIVESYQAEPVAYMIGGHYLMHANDPKVDNYSSAIPLYTAPPAPVALRDREEPVGYIHPSTPFTFGKSSGAIFKEETRNYSKPVYAAPPAPVSVRERAEPVAYIIQDKYQRESGEEGHLSHVHASQYISGDDICEHEISCTPLFKEAPTAPVVPDEMPKGLAGQIVSLLAHNIGDKFLAQKIWNACRAAMLNKAQAQPETKSEMSQRANQLLVDTTELSNRITAQTCNTYEQFASMARSEMNPRKLVRIEHANWSDDTFGNVGPVGPLKHLAKEAIEAAENPGDLSEWADMQFLLWDAQRRAGYSDEQITKAMVKKLAENKARSWPEPKDGEPRHHIKNGAE